MWQEYIKKYQETVETTGDVQEVKWDVKNKKGNEKVDISFQLLDKMNNEVRGVNDQIRAVIVDGNLKNIQQRSLYLLEMDRISYISGCSKR